MDEELLKESRNCKDCLCWLRHCKAECCKGFFVKIDPDKVKTGDTLTLHANFNFDQVTYYKYHFVTANRGFVQFKVDDFRVVSEEQIFVYKTCKYLSDKNLCTVHGTIKQPLICKSIHIGHYKDLNGTQLTSNCLFKYREEDEKSEVK